MNTENQSEDIGSWHYDPTLIVSKEESREKRVRRFHLKSFLFCLMIGYSILVALIVLGALIVNAVL